MSHRTQIMLTDEQYARLMRESQRTGVGLAELIRRALDESFREVNREDARRAIEESAGAWADRDFDGERYVEGLRRGMARRLAR